MYILKYALCYLAIKNQILLRLSWNYKLTNYYSCAYVFNLLKPENYCMGSQKFNHNLFLSLILIKINNIKNHDSNAIISSSS